MIAPPHPKRVGCRPMAAELKRAFGLAVRLERVRRGLSQRRLATAARVDRAHLSGIERGKVDPGIEVQYRLAQALGTSVMRLWAQVAAEADQAQAHEEGGGESRPES